MSIQISGDQIKSSAVSAAKLDLSSGTFDFSSASLRAATPSENTDVAIKSYVDGLVAQGVYWKESVRCATTGAITISTALIAGQAIDGITLVAGDRVLVKDQAGSDAPENGIYVAVAVGQTPARSTDMNEGGEFSGSAMFCEEGSQNAEQGFTCTNNGTVNVGTDNIAFTQFTGLGQVEAGAALSKVANRLDVSVDDSSIEVSSDALRVKASGITNDMLQGSIVNSKLQNNTISGVALGSNLNSLTKATNGGVQFSSFNGSAAVSDLALDVNDLSPATVDVGADSIAIYDADADVTGKEAIADVVTAIAGDALTASSGVLAVNADNSSLEIAADTLRVKASGVTNAMLANSTISGVALGANLNSLSKATNGGVNFSPFNGSAAVSNLQLDINDLSVIDVDIASDSIAIYDAGGDATGKCTIQSILSDAAGSALTESSGVLSVGVDDSSIEVSSDALRVKSAGITDAMLAGSVQTSKLLLSTRWKVFSPDGNTADFDLDDTLSANLADILVFRNGIAVVQVSGTPSGGDQYSVSLTGGASGKTRITMGANISASDNLRAWYVK